MKYPQLVSMPSAVSDWLEEQLEARGIDSVVYTRYILSLLHQDSADFICPDQDSYFSHSFKEVRRSGAGRKRFRRANDWWTYEQTDADQLKRSAAVECLMSASDQKCGIESLVDELCEKLKEINSDSITSTNPSDATVNHKTSSPRELANQYYAAFPPLSRKSASPDIITLIPKWIGSPKKKPLRKQNRAAGYDDKFRCKVEPDIMKAKSAGKSRLNYIGRNKKEMGFSRKTVEKDWDTYGFNNVKNRRPNHWPVTKEVQKEEQCLENEIWQNEDNDMNMYEDLLDDIRELLNSPEPQEDTVELMNLANMRDTGRKSFIQCGTNITSSIWSTNVPDESSENSFNAALASQNSDVLLGIKFSAISIGGGDCWPTEASMAAENKTNLFFENCSKSNANEFSSLPWDTYPYKLGNLEKWSDAESYESDVVAVNNVMAKSLSKLNHHKEKSCFTEVIPHTTSRANFNIFKSSTDAFFKSDSAAKKSEVEKDKDDLLTSVRSHFKPINEKPEARGQHYADGTSFVIPNALDKVNYKRSESGGMYVDSEYGFTKKYLEYKTANEWNTSEFILKFNIRQNDKACQTDFGNSQATLNAETDQPDFYFPGDEDFVGETAKPATKTDCSFGNDVHDGRPDSVIGEIGWKCETKHCDKCNNNTWSGTYYDPSCGSQTWGVFERSVGDIWNGGDVCLTCLGANAQLPNQQRMELREDVSHDGEQLLSDLSSLQKCYMDDEPPASEVSCDIAELLEEPRDRKRRHSNLYRDVAGQGGSWSFASRLKEDCLIQMSTIPTLRSVTL